MTLDDVLRAPLPARVDDVVERLRGIEEALPARVTSRGLLSPIV